MTPDIETLLANNRRFVERQLARTVKDTQAYFARQLQGLEEASRFRRLVELNVIEQVYNLGKTNVVQAAWRARGRPFIHGWVFDIASGRIAPQTPMIGGDDQMHAVCKFDGARA